MAPSTTLSTSFSVIIPVYHEASCINETVRHVQALAEGEIEILVVDGAPEGDTLAALQIAEVIRVQSPPGRGVQMNIAAQQASGDVLLFLHADTQLPSRAFAAIRSAISQGSVGGAFGLDIDSPRLSLKIIAWFANWRSCLERVPYGDQAQFVRADTFRELGGFPDIPLMEDVELFQKIRRKGLPIRLLRSKVLTSSRRWDREGVWNRTIRNWWLRIRHGVGTPAGILAAQYRPEKTMDE